MLLAKTATYGVLHVIVAFLVGWTVSGDVHIGLGIAMLEPLAQIGGFYFHEKIWQKYQARKALEKGLSAEEAHKQWHVKMPCCDATREMLKQAQVIKARLQTKATSEHKAA
jgi:uncharacterized membrane protein